MILGDTLNLKAIKIAKTETTANLRASFEKMSHQGMVH